MLRLIKHQITNNKFLISQLDLGYEIIRKKVAALAVVFSMASSTLANAQEEDGKVSFSVQGDLVSSYIWRGFYQTGASFQPTLSLGVGNFSLTAWGSTDFQGANSTSMPAAKEIDLTAAYTFGSAGLHCLSLAYGGQGKALAVILTSKAMKQITILKQVWLTLCLLRSYLCLSLGISCLPVKTKMKMETKTILLMWS